MRQGPVRALAVDATGQNLVTAGADGQVRPRAVSACCAPPDPQDDVFRGVCLSCCCSLQLAARSLLAFLQRACPTQGRCSRTARAPGL